MKTPMWRFHFVVISNILKHISSDYILIKYILHEVTFINIANSISRNPHEMAKMHLLTNWSMSTLDRQVVSPLSDLRLSVGDVCFRVCSTCSRRLDSYSSASCNFLFAFFSFFNRFWMIAVCKEHRKAEV